MRKLIVSKWVRNKIDELESYLKNNLKPVSYTHLTLPTILLV